MPDSKDIRLVVEIKNRQPIELMDLTKSLIALANQFNNYAAVHGEGKEGREAKLYVKEIRSGSVILELIETATIGVLPFVENVNTIVGFAGFIKDTYSYFLGKKEEKSAEYTSIDYKDFSQFINPIALDNGSQININTTINGDVTFRVHLDSIEANAAQNAIEREKQALKLRETKDEIKTTVLLTWYQARNDSKSTIGNKGVIEQISTKPLDILFDNDELKEAILHSDSNPFTTVFVVDVEIQTVRQIPVAYKVMKLHQSLSLDNS